MPSFISSTFRDMHAKEWLKGQRWRQQPIGLRVGDKTDRTKTER